MIMNKSNYPLRVSKNTPPSFFRKDKWWNRKSMKKLSKIILCFVSTLEKHLQSNQYQDLLFEIRHIRTKYVYLLFRLKFDFGFFIKPWRNRLCIWIISYERVDLDCNLWGSLPFKLTTVGEVWWHLQWKSNKRLQYMIDWKPQRTLSII